MVKIIITKGNVDPVKCKSPLISTDDSGSWVIRQASYLKHWDILLWLIENYQMKDNKGHILRDAIIDKRWDVARKLLDHIKYDQTTYMMILMLYKMVMTMVK